MDIVGSDLIGFLLHGTDGMVIGFDWMDSWAFQTFGRDCVMSGDWDFRVADMIGVAFG